MMQVKMSTVLMEKILSSCHSGLDEGKRLTCPLTRWSMASNAKSRTLIEEDLFRDRKLRFQSVPIPFGQMKEFFLTNTARDGP